MSPRLFPWSAIAAPVACLVLFVAAPAAAAAGADGVAAPSAATHVGRRVQPFALPDAGGQSRAWAEFASGQAVVVAFLGVECPLARFYARRLEQIAGEYAARGVTVLGIDSNQQDSAADLAQFRDDLGVTFPLLLDPGNTVADDFAAVRTPQVFLLDAAGTIRYVGRVDDQYAFGQGVGYQRTQVGRHDLREALDDLLAGLAVRVAETAAVGCLIGRVRPAQEESDVTWADPIAAIFQRRCQECHRSGEVAPFALVEHQEAAAWQEMVREVIEQDRMPPWGADPRYGNFSNDARLTAEEKRQVLTWLERGAPAGDLSRQPPPRQFVTGWQIGEPDEVIYMSPRPFEVPADGLVDYQYFDVDPQFTTDRWVQAVECRAGAPSVVHHINVFLLTPDMPADYEREDLTNHLLWGTAPGLQSVTFAPGTAYRIPAGTKLVFQMHYTTNGTAQSDRSFMGLIYADPAEVERRVEMKLAVNPRFEIPPGAARHEVQSWYELPHDGWIYALSPHLHLRGKSFRYDMHRPDDDVETLLEVPRFDFNWQHIYVLEEPLAAPRGTLLHCTAVYDNSAENPVNPNPAEPVRWGDQIWQEMMIGYVLVGFDRDAVTEPIDAAGVARAHAAQRRRTRFAAGAVATLGSIAALAIAAWLLRRR